MLKYLIVAVLCTSSDDDCGTDTLGVRQYENGVVGQLQSHSRFLIIENIKQRRSTYNLGYNDGGILKLGRAVHVVSVDGTDYLRIDDHLIAEDYLGKLPEVKPTRG